jgi:hypothetical protein
LKVQPAAGASPAQRAAHGLADSTYWEVEMSRALVSFLACCASLSIPAWLGSCSSGDSDGTPAGGGSAGSSTGQGGGAGTGGSAGSPTGQGGGAGTGGSTQLTCEDSGTVDMTGLWAIYLRYSLSLVSQPGGAITMCPVDQVSSSTMYLLADIKHSGNGLEIQPRHCSMTLPVVTGIVGDCDPTAPNLVSVNIIPPQKLLDADVPMELAKGTVSGSTPGSSLTMQDRFTFTMGTSKHGTEMPKWLDTKAGCGASDLEIGRTTECAQQCVSDCSVLLDDDADQYPAVTFHVCGTTPEDVQSKVKCNAEQPSEGGTTIQGRVSLVYTTDPMIQGTVKSSCEASGTFAATTIYNVVGADLYLANTKISVASSLKSLPAYEIDPVKSQFRMIRVDGKYGAPNWNADFSEHLSACKTAVAHQNEMQ